MCRQVGPGVVSQQVGLGGAVHRQVGLVGGGGSVSHRAPPKAAHIPELSQRRISVFFLFSLCLVCCR